MGQSLRDYGTWHDSYDDPNSSLAWRLGVVRGQISAALDRHRGQPRVVSACAGDGRDLVGVLAARTDADRVAVALLEIEPRIAERARLAAAAAGLDRVQVHVVDAGRTDSYVGLVPADLVLLVGIFGNITDEDLHRTITMSPALCSPDATLLWSRGRDPDMGGDKNDRVREWFGDAGFVELDYVTRDIGSRPAVGAMRYAGPPHPLVPGQTTFTFIR